MWIKMRLMVGRATVCRGADHAHVTLEDARVRGEVRGERHLFPGRAGVRERWGRTTNRELLGISLGMRTVSGCELVRESRRWSELFALRTG